MALVSSVIGQGTADAVTSAGIDTTGATILAFGLISYGAATEPTVSDSKGNTWTQRTAYTDGVTRTRVYYAANPTVGSGHTFTATGTGSFSAVAVSAHDGIATTTPYDVENGGSFSSGTTGSTGSVTPSEDGELLVAVWGYAANGQPTGVSVDNSFTVMGQASNTGNSFGVAHAYLYQTPAAAVNPAASWTGSTSGSAAIATFKAAGGGDTFTATAAVTISSATCVGSATFAPGTKTATTAVTISGMTCAGSAEFDAPIYDADAAVTISNQTCSGTATFEAPVFEASAAVTISNMVGAGTALFATVIFQANAAVTITNQTCSGDATFVPGSKTAVAAVTITNQVGSGSASFIPQERIASADVTISNQICQGFAFTGPVTLFTANADVTISTMTLSGVGRSISPELMYGTWNYDSAEPTQGSWSF